MNKEVAKSCLGWEGINNKIQIAKFMTKKCRLSVIAEYAPVEPCRTLWTPDGNISDWDKFYLQLQEQEQMEWSQAEI